MSVRAIDLKDYLPQGYFTNDTDDDLSNFVAILNSQLNEWVDDIDVVALRMRDPALFPTDFMYLYSGMMDLELCDDLSTANSKALLRNAYYIYNRKGTSAGVKRLIGTSLGLDDDYVEVIEDSYITRKTLICNDYESKTIDCVQLNEAVADSDYTSLLLNSVDGLEPIDIINISTGSTATTATISDCIKYYPVQGVAEGVTATGMTDSHANFPMDHILNGSYLKVRESGVIESSYLITANTVTSVTLTSGSDLVTDGFSTPNYSIVINRISIPKTYLDFPSGATVWSVNNEWNTYNNIMGNLVARSWYSLVGPLTATSVSSDVCANSGETWEADIYIGKTLQITDGDLTKYYLITDNNTTGITCGGHNLEEDGFSNDSVFYVKKPRSFIIINVEYSSASLKNSIKEWLNFIIKNYVPVNTHYSIIMS